MPLEFSEQCQSEGNPGPLQAKDLQAKPLPANERKELANTEAVHLKYLDFQIKTLSHDPYFACTVTDMRNWLAEDLAVLAKPENKSLREAVISELRQPRMSASDVAAKYFPEARVHPDHIDLKKPTNPGSGQRSPFEKFLSLFK
jgi:hypothetical protein